jgi:hypothetical protein
MKIILDALKIHRCTLESCGGIKPHHSDCMEFDSDLFVEAGKIVEASTQDYLPPY